jgi:CHAT domain-containing protein
MQDYDILHLATHAQFVAGSPNRSFIQFSDAPLTLEALPQLNWTDSQLSLLVLSACETAVGDRQAELGFAGLALQAGIPTAIASLWQVSDLGTVALMGEFYQQLKTAPTKAKALQQAQIAMIRQQVKLDGDRLQGSRSTITLPDALTLGGATDFSHPFYWAGFSVIGSP